MKIDDFYSESNGPDCKVNGEIVHEGSSIEFKLDGLDFCIQVLCEGNGEVFIEKVNRCNDLNISVFN